MLLAIETSCDETAVAILDLEKSFDRSSPTSSFLLVDEISSQTKLHQPFGGVVPELAAREHVKNLPIMVHNALASQDIGIERIRAIAVTSGPGLKGCLLVGVAFAKALALRLGIPLLSLHHMEGHLFAGELLSELERPKYPCLALVVSGGHTLVVLMKDFQNYEVLANTKDDAAGEAFDKAATILGLPYPGGPSLSKLAALGDRKRFGFPIGMIQDDTAFSFSGLKTAIYRTAEKHRQELADPQLLQDLAASVEEAIVRALVRKSMRALEKTKPTSFLLTGGVAANGFLRSELQQELARRGVAFAVPPARWCTDNAAMIGILAARIIQRNPEAHFSWKPQAGLLGPNTLSDVGVRAKWPLTELSIDRQNIGDA